MASETVWRWAIRQAFGISDYVSDDGADRFIVEKIVQEIPTVASGSNNAMAAYQAQQAWEHAPVIIDRVRKLGPEGKFDGFVLRPSDDTRRTAAQSVIQGTSLLIEDQPMIFAVIDRLAEWISEHPQLPESHR